MAEQARGTDALKERAEKYLAGGSSATNAGYRQEALLVRDLLARLTALEANVKQLEAVGRGTEHDSQPEAPRAGEQNTTTLTPEGAAVTKENRAENGAQRRELYDPDWLSVRAVAEKLSVSCYQVRKWIDAGQFDEIVVFSARLTRISHASLERFLSKNRMAAS